MSSLLKRVHLRTDRRHPRGRSQPVFHVLWHHAQDEQGRSESVQERPGTRRSVVLPSEGRLMSRIWVGCPRCEDDPWRRYFDGEDPETAFSPCPECGEPPRCIAGRVTDTPCPRVAQVYEETGWPRTCELHTKAHELDDELGMLRESLAYLELWLKQAELTRLDPLIESMCFIRAECELEIARAHSELTAVREEL